MRTLTTRSLAVVAGALTLAGGAVVVPTIANAQSADPMFTVSPDQALPGQTVTFTATDCTSDTYPQDSLSVIVANIGGGVELSTDETGQASGPFTIGEGFGPGGYEFTASCMAHVDDTQVLVFNYPTTVTIDVGAAPTTTTTAAPASTTTTTAKPAAAAAATATRPSFTG